jgi:hypothetical protein
MRNPISPQSPKLPLYKEKLRILAMLRKKGKTQKETTLFFRAHGTHGSNDGLGNGDEKLHYPH